MHLTAIRVVASRAADAPGTARATCTSPWCAVRALRVHSARVVSGPVRVVRASRVRAGLARRARAGMWVPMGVEAG